MSSRKGSILFVIIKIAYVYLLYSRPYNIGAVLLVLGVRTTSFHLISFPSRSLRLKREPKKSFLLWLYNVKKRRSVCTRQEDSRRNMVVRHNLWAVFRFTHSQFLESTKVTRVKKVCPKIQNIWKKVHFLYFHKLR